jgi:AraC-like DNA-binding protein
MSLLEQVDLAIRFGIVTMCLVLCIHLLNMRNAHRAYVLVAALVQTSLHTLAESEQGIALFGPLADPIHATFVIEPILIIWACLSFFRDDFRPQTWHIAAASGFVVVSIFAAFGLVTPWVVGVLKLGAFGYLLYATIVCHSDDLVEVRRGFRQVFCTEVALACIVITGLSIYCAYFERPIWINLVVSGIIFALILSLLLWVLRVRADLFPESKLSSTKREPRAENGLTLAENALAVRLDKAMDDGVWRQEGLTIRALAEQLDAPEHRLRRVINRGLGYRNFSAFVNERRVAAAARAFSDPERADVPVITIAHEAGFASLGPFNRAFREITGVSPTDYRRNTVGTN